MTKNYTNLTKKTSKNGATDSIRVIDRFYSKAPELRKIFESRFENPLQASSDRFCWDYWRVKDQYQLLRTPAEDFFGKAFQAFLNELMNWSRQNLGCQMISHPWLSAYVDGSFQALHSDVPHGPWSFVYSLTPWQSRRFTGGETLIAKPKLLRYFQEMKHDESHEQVDFFETIEPEMNRLTIFDPRYPHGVKEVKGEHDLLKSRLVIHGWFTEPRPMLEGALSYKKILKPMDELALQLISAIEPEEYTGLLSTRFKIDSSGKVISREVVCGHLVQPSGESMSSRNLDAILDRVEISFPKASGPSILTLPVEFKR